MLNQITVQLRKGFGRFAEQIIAVSSAEIVNAGFVPAMLAVVFGGQVRLNRFYFGVEVGIEEEGKRQAIARRSVADSVWCRAVQTAGHSIQHVSDVTNEGVFNRRRFDPS